MMMMMMMMNVVKTMSETKKMTGFRVDTYHLSKEMLVTAGWFMIYDKILPTAHFWWPYRDKTHATVWLQSQILTVWDSTTGPTGVP